jgi:autotransporter-associated beta strand protein
VNLPDLTGSRGERAPGHGRGLPAGLRLLLASSSAGALLIGASAPALAGCLNGVNGGQVLNSSPVASFSIPSGSSAGCLVFSGTPVSGSVVNAGTIRSPNPTNTPTGILVTNGSTIHGSLSNSGTISAGGAGILVDANNNLLLGGITNSGGITGVTGINLEATSSFAGGIINAGSGVINAQSIGINVDSIPSFSGGVTNSGTIIASGVGVEVTGVTNFSGGITNNGTITGGGGAKGIYVGSGSTFVGGITNTGKIATGLTAIFVAGQVSFSGGISNSGMLVSNATGIVVLNSGFQGGITNTGSISGRDGIVVQNSGPVSIFDSGVITETGSYAVYLAANAAGNTFTLGPGYSITGLVAGQGADTFQLGGAGSGTFNLSSIGTQYTGFTTFNVVSGSWTATGSFAPTNPWTVAGGTLVITGSLGNAGGVTLSGGTIVIGSNNALGAGSLSMAAGTTLSFLNSGNFTVANNISISGDPYFAPPAGTTQTISGVISDGTSPGVLEMQGPGKLVLTAANSYSGNTVISGGTLEVDGSIASSALTTVNSGATLMGTGTVGATQVNAGGTLAPGPSGGVGTLLISGSLAFQSGALYLVDINGSAASKAVVNGTASLAGAQVGISGSTFNLNQKYTILTASGGVSGSFDPTVVTGALYKATLSYDPTDVFVTFSLNQLTPLLPAGTSTNVRSVASAIDGYIQNGGTPPAGFQALFNLTPAQIGLALTQASGESATAAQQTTFLAMSQFMDLLTDRFAGRGNSINGGTSPTGYADEGGASAYTANRRTSNAFAMFTKAPPVAPFVPRWSVWASGFGGSQSTSGNAIVGSNDTTSRIAGTAVGADYLFSANTLAGFALAGGGTSFAVNNLGSGHSDLFQAGAYVRHTEGAAYVTGALAYGWQDITTNRTLSIAGVDQLRAEFNANAYSGRVEGGYRFVAPWIGGVGITPYAAGQFTTFDLPAYAESVASGTPNFALTYAAKSVTDARSELGIRTDKAFAMASGVLMLRGRLAWAHDYDPDRTVAATLQALPGASFVVGGAAQASDSALTTASVEMKWTNNWSAAATFEGEFSNVTSSYAGKGVVRYVW